MLFGDHGPTSKLSMSWPRTATQVPINVGDATQVPINVGDATYDPLFPYGFGLTYP